MPLRLILRPEAAGDIESIYEYLARRDPGVADRFARSVFAACDDLTQAPGLGSLKPRRRRRSDHADIRSWNVPGFPNHLIFYHAHEDVLVVIAVLHGARNLPRILRKRP